MKVLSGKYKGHALLSFPKTIPLRPMTQRVKKSVFDTIRPWLQDSTKVLDLFSGTGQVSFEALSQGVGECHAVEQSTPCCRLIQKNAQKLGVPSSQFVLHQKDVFQFLKKYKEEPFDIIFVDPPFPRHYGESIIQCLNLSLACSRDTLVVLELPSKESISEHPKVELQAQKNFGDKNIYLLKIKKQK